MNVQPSCYPCIFNQIVEASNRVGLPHNTQRIIIREVLEYLLSVPDQIILPEIGQFVHRLVRKHAEDQDPYAEVKTKFNAKLLELLPAIREEVRLSADPLRQAIRYAIAGNVIDFAAVRNGNINLQDELKRAADNHFAIDHYRRFKAKLDHTGSIVYLGDNAGEIVMDRLLIEVLRQMSDAKISLVVRGAPVLNDATLQDAQQTGLDKIVPVLADGNDAPGMLYYGVSQEIRDLLNGADMIIAKGQGNYESLSDVPLEVYFLFRVKCQVVAEKTGASVGSYIMANSQRIQKQGSSHEQLPC